MSQNAIVRTCHRFAIGALVVLLAACGPVCHAQETSADEYEIRAAMLFNITRFVEWPAPKASDSNFAVCLLGSDPSTAALATLLSGKSVGGRPTVLRRLDKDESAEGCHILFVASPGRKRFDELRPQLVREAVLTVGDQEWFTGDGGMVGLPLIDSRVRIEINLNATQQGGLSISSKLLRLATLVH